MPAQTDEEYYEGRDFVTGDDAMGAIAGIVWGLVTIVIIVPVTFIVRTIAERRRSGRHRG